MTTKHTPGPWIPYFDERADEWTARLPRIEGSAGQVYVCDVSGPEDQREANTHLIAAAPELYEALNRVIQAIALDTEEDAVAIAKALGCEDPSNIIDVCALARAALAKAEVQE